MTASDLMAPQVPPERWERVRDGLRGRIATVLQSHPGLVTVLRRGKVWGLWASALGLIVLLIVSRTYRGSLKVYVACFWLLIAWFAVSRLKTVRWSSLARMFSFGVALAPVIAVISYQLIHVIKLTALDPGPASAIAGISEESLKLVPVVLVAVIAPGRVRRFAASDWLLLSFAAGLGFQAWEELLRRLNEAIARPGLFDVLSGGTNQGPGSGYPQYGLGLLSGGSGTWTNGDVWGYAGHHVFTGLIGASIGLGVALWRRAQTRAARNRRLLSRAGAIALPVLMWVLCVSDHVSYNAALNDPAWPQADHVSTPWVIRTVWSWTGHGTGKGWLLLFLLLCCLLVDAWRLHQSGPMTDLPDPLPPTPEQALAEAGAVAAKQAAAKQAAAKQAEPAYPPVGYPPAGPPVGYPVAGPPVGFPVAGPPVGYPPAGPPVGYPVGQAAAGYSGYPGYPGYSGYPAPAGQPGYPARAGQPGYPAAPQPVPGSTGRAKAVPLSTAWWLQPRDVINRQLATRFGEVGGFLRPLVTAFVALGVYVARDLVVIIAAHVPAPGEPRRAAIVHGRAAAVMLREVRSEAIAHWSRRIIVHIGDRGPRDPVGTEVSRRRRARLVALAGLVLLLLAGTVLAATVAHRIGTDLTPPAAAHDTVHWLAGQFQRLGEWWDQRSIGQKILIGFGLAGLFALSGGSLTLAFGASGVLTYGMEHGQGEAAFIRDPSAATRNYLDNVTPASAALDLLDFGLTFAPGNFAGAAAGKGARSLGAEFFEDQAAFAARRRSMLSSDRGAFDPSAYRSGLKTGWGTPAQREQWVTDQINDPSNIRPANYGQPGDIAYQKKVTRQDFETKISTSDGKTTQWADGLTTDPDKVVAVEAKYVRSPGKRSFYEGNGYPPALDKALVKFDREIHDYGAVMADPGNPVGRLRLVTSTQESADFLGARARSILGPNVDLVVVVVPP